MTTSFSSRTFAAGLYMAAFVAATSAAAQEPAPSASVRIMPPVVPPHRVIEEARGTPGYRPGHSTAYDPHGAAKAIGLMGLILGAASVGSFLGHMAGKRAP